MTSIHPLVIKALRRSTNRGIGPASLAPGISVVNLKNSLPRTANKTNIPDPIMATDKHWFYNFPVLHVQEILYPNPLTTVKIIATIASAALGERHLSNNGMLLKKLVKSFSIATEGKKYNNEGSKAKCKHFHAKTTPKTNTSTMEKTSKIHNPAPKYIGPAVLIFIGPQYVGSSITSGSIDGFFLGFICSVNLQTLGNFWIVVAP